MKVTIEKTEKVEIDIQLPYFSKGSGHYYKVEKNQTIILFNTKYDFYSLEVKDVMYSYPLSLEPVTENEFDLVLETIKTKINKL